MGKNTLALQTGILFQNTFYVFVEYSFLLKILIEGLLTFLKGPVFVIDTSEYKVLSIDKKGQYISRKNSQSQVTKTKTSLQIN